MVQIRNICRWMFVHVVLVVATSTAPASDSSIVHHCSNADVSVQAPAPGDQTEVCAGAEDAVVHFARFGLRPTHALLVEIVPVLPDLMSDNAVGCYLEDEQRILVLSFAEFIKAETWFNIPIDRSMYRSLVTHEVAHAIADCNFSIPEPTIQAKEYLAYIAMFEKMSPALRQRIMAANPGKGFDSEQKINSTIYLCDPMRFAVRAYRHYRRPENGEVFVRRVLSGRALSY